MQLDLTAIPDAHEDGMAARARTSVVTDLGLAAVALALAPLLGPLDAELREVLERGKPRLSTPRPAPASWSARH